MKKFILIGMAVLMTVAALGVAGVVYAFAQTPTPVPSPFGQSYGPGMHGGMGGMMRGRGGMGGGMMGADGQYGPMHEYMQAAMAEALDMSVEDLNAELTAGKTMWQVAEAQGLSTEEFQALMLDARTAALAKMVADGVITQEQADAMSARMQGVPGQGGCPGMGGQGGRMGPGGGGRWNQQQPAAAPNGNG